MAKLSLPTQLSTKENRKLRSLFTKRIAERLKDLRKSKKMTQQELAETAGLHLTYVGHLELGKYHPTLFVMWKISKALNIPIKELVEV